MTKSVGPGTWSVEDLTTAVAEGTIETVMVAFPDLYGRLMGKRFEARFFLDSVLKAGTHGCNYLLTVDMEMEPIPGYASANWEKGYGDFHLVPDLTSLRPATWLDRTALVLCDLEDSGSHEPVVEAPRSVLRNQLERAAARDLTVLTASELEYYIYRDAYRDLARQGFTGLEPAGWYVEDYHLLQGTRVEDLNAPARRHLGMSGIPVESTKGEWGLGQHEINVRYSECLEMADRQTLIKQCFKDLAGSLGVSVTFMAKVSAAGAGSSCHLHLSLWNGENNLFDGDGSLGSVRCSDTFRWFLGGWMEHVEELMVWYAPTVNSYKRFQALSWAPTRIAWSPDNRTAGFRIVGEGKSLRIECRIPGADCNPYLAYAAALASGLDGIERKIEPPEAFQGNVYSSQDTKRVPSTLHDATERFEKSVFARETFGDDVVEHYAHFFRTEQALYDRAVTDWERIRYFERI